MTRGSEMTPALTNPAIARTVCFGASNLLNADTAPDSWRYFYARRTEFPLGGGAAGVGKQQCPGLSLTGLSSRRSAGHIKQPSFQRSSTPLTKAMMMTSSVTVREAARETSPITVADLTLQDGEPRVHDLCLAEALGFAEPISIRKLIIRNLKEIVTLGPSGHRVRMVTIGSGAKRPVTEYYLNEAQALLICMFARTERAAEVRKQVIEVFMTWRRGETPQTPLQAEYVPVLSLAQQIMLSNIASARFMRAGDDSHREEILEHVFLALHSFEPRREMTAGSRQCDEVTL